MAESTTEPVTVAVTDTALITEEIAPSRLPARVSWGAIFGGTVAALGVWALLYAFGLALGLSAVDEGDPGSLRSSGIFTGIWGLLSPLIALFVGGVVTSRIAGSITKGNGAMHGLVMWGLTTITGAWVIANVVASLMGGALTVTRATIEAGGAVGQAVAGAPLGDLAQTVGIDATSALEPVNRRLRAEGKAEVSAPQLQAAVQDIVRTGIRQGRLDRETLVAAIAQNTALTRADVDEIAGRIETQVLGAAQGAGSVAQSAQRTALKAVDTTGKAFWGIFGALFLGMLAAVGGGALGGSYKMQDWAERARARSIRHRGLTTRHAAS